MSYKNYNFKFLIISYFLISPAILWANGPIYEIIAKQERDELGLPSIKYDELLQKYKEYEGKDDEINAFQLASMWGGINYTMSLDKMKTIVREKFKTLRAKGQIISPSEFEKIKEKYYTERARPLVNLERIWGADYLKEKINNSDKLKNRYAVPNYVIVVDDPKVISVKLSFLGDLWPSVQQLLNGAIYFEKITGKEVARWDSGFSEDVVALGQNSGIGYDDFSDPGNIILDSRSGKKYIVDTEQKSFRILFPNNIQKMLWYFKKRFDYLNDLPTTYFNYTF